MTVRICGALVRLTAEDIATYNAVPWGAWKIEEPLTCELEAVHGGPHAAAVQSYPEVTSRAYWALWNDGQPYRVAVLPYCTVLRGDQDVSGDAIGCALYACHGGGHVWTD